MNIHAHKYMSVQAYKYRPMNIRAVLFSHLYYSTSMFLCHQLQLDTAAIMFPLCTIYNTHINTFYYMHFIFTPGISNPTISISILPSSPTQLPVNIQPSSQHYTPAVESFYLASLYCIFAHLSSVPHQV